MGYLTFFAVNGRFIGFGFLLTFASSFGQTFFIALSGADIRAEFSLSHGEFGSLFALATIASALSLIWVGRLIDQVDLRLYTGLACAGLVAAVALIGLSPSLFWLVVALYLARLTGQGLMVHISSTSMARYFPADRGKAISLAGMGQAAGEALLPMAMIALLAAVGWRDAWLLTAVSALAVLAGLLPWLLRGQGERHRAYLAMRGGAAGQKHDAAEQWTRGQVVRDIRFHLLMAAMFGLPFIATGLFFHQVHIATVKGWSLELLAGAFVLFAVMRIVVSLAAGPLIDRFGARRLVPFMFIPLAATVLVIALSDHPAVLFAYLGLLGIAAGLLIPALSALWPELYGVAHLGAIRALVMACIVFASATAPALFGWAFDAGLSIETIAWLCLVYVVLSGGVAALALRLPPRAASRA